mmetsp:Transcript_2624/g.8651  ORF Transcript_2624/g.8651 Transcript_2624/m.8651 type:complete len:232 (-) Transcript_2624:143-838(-)
MGCRRARRGPRRGPRPPASCGPAARGRARDRRPALGRRGRHGARRARARERWRGRAHPRRADGRRGPPGDRLGLGPLRVAAVRRARRRGSGTVQAAGGPGPLRARRGALLRGRGPPRRGGDGEPRPGPGPAHRGGPGPAGRAAVLGQTIPGRHSRGGWPPQRGGVGALRGSRVRTAGEAVGWRDVGPGPLMAARIHMICVASRNFVSIEAAQPLQLTVNDCTPRFVSPAEL